MQHVVKSLLDDNSDDEKGISLIISICNFNYLKKERVKIIEFIV
jgi:hypothetical protein